MTGFIATIAYVREQGLRSVTVFCHGQRAGGFPCSHSADVAIAGMRDDLTLAAIARRTRCEQCGAVGKAEVRPNWGERPPAAVTGGGNGAPPRGSSNAK